jgi:hypothetical protein
MNRRHIIILILLNSKNMEDKGRSIMSLLFSLINLGSFIFFVYYKRIIDYSA